MEMRHKLPAQASNQRRSNGDRQSLSESMEPTARSSGSVSLGNALDVECQFKCGRLMHVRHGILREKMFKRFEKTYKKMSEIGIRLRQMIERERERRREQILNRLTKFN